MTLITLQHVFNTAWQAFIIEDKPPGMDPETKKCSYSGCAFGLCFPEGHPAKKETRTIEEVISKYPELFDESIIKLSETYERAYYLFNFQYKLHDDLCYWNPITNKPAWKHSKEEMKQIYRYIAEQYKLTIPGEDTNVTA